MNLRQPGSRIVLALLLTGLVLAGVWLLVHGKTTPAAVKSGSPQPTTPSVAMVDGISVVRLDTATQTQSGIGTDVLPAVYYQAEIPAYGTVLDLTPLIDLHMRYFAALADVGAARATAAAARQENARSRLLYLDNQTLALKTYQAAQAVYLADQAKADGAVIDLENIKATALQQFGTTLVRWTFAPHSPEFSRLLKRQAVLLRVTLPLQETIAAPAQIQVGTGNDQLLPAYLVSPAVQSDPAVQGSAFIYRVAAPIATGTNIAAYLPISSQKTPGILIPATAIVWYGGQPWAYRQIDAEHFGRYRVSQQYPMQHGFFVTTGFKAGQRVVVSGAQQLLSEELRPQPGSASACKDPECDD